MNELAHDPSPQSWELEGVRREIEPFADDVSLRRTLPGVTNSAGNLGCTRESAAHVGASWRYRLRHNRTPSSAAGRSRAEVVAELDAAISRAWRAAGAFRCGRQPTRKPSADRRPHGSVSMPPGDAAAFHPGNWAPPRGHGRHAHERPIPVRVLTDRYPKSRNMSQPFARGSL
jgi:hypothetical protein